MIDVTKALPDGIVEEVKASSSKKSATDQKPKKIEVEETKEDDLKSLLNFKPEDLKTH